MICPKCGAEVPDGKKICPNCECSIAPVGQQAAKKPMMYAIVALAAVALIALLVAAFAGRSKPVTEAVSPEATKAKPITAAPVPAPVPRPITQAPVPVPQPPAAPQKPQVPQDVADYLNYVQRIEARRQVLLQDQGKALALAAGGQAQSLENLFDMAMDPDSNAKPVDPFKPVREELSRQVTNWQMLIRQFDAKPVPQPCGPFAGAYRMALATQTASINRVATILTGVSENSRQSMTDAIGELQEMKRDPRTQGGIDRAVETADKSLGQLCAQYGIQKPFDIPKEQQGGSLIGL